MLKANKIGTRGAALVEYVILLALISLVAIGSVAALGSRVSTNFNEVTTDLADVEIAMEEATGNEADIDLGIWLTTAADHDWNGDGAPGPTAIFSRSWGDAETLPNGVTKTNNGWKIDLDKIIDPTTDLSTLRYDAWVSQRGTFEKRHPEWGDSTSSYTVHARAYWLRDGQNKLPIVLDEDYGSPSGEVLAYNLASGGSIPDNVIGIQLVQLFFCNPGSICTRDEFGFGIEFYPSP